MAKHLTQDATTKSLAAVRLDSSTAHHLVTLTQKTNWSNKGFLATSSAAKWAACMATGIEAYPSRQGTTAVYADTQNLINAVGTCMNSLSWRDGYHPIVNAFTRGLMRGPYSHRSGISSNNARAEYIHSVAAWKFKLHKLHFSRMTSFKAYLRVYVPSLTVQRDYTEPLPLNPGGDYGNVYCTLIRESFWSGASQLCCRVSTELPTLAADIASGYDAWEFQGNANNGTTVTSDTSYKYHSVAYNPYHGDDCVAMPVWTANQRTPSGSSAPSSQPTIYYHDFEIANTSNRAVLLGNPNEVWILAHFKRVNGFAENSATNHGMAPNVGACAWAYRADLVLSCTGSAFNT